MKDFIKKYQYDLFGTWVYAIDQKNTYRYLLGHFFNDSFKRILVCFGINPSTATPDKLDNTVNKVSNTALRNNYDGFIMFNIYPHRATDPNRLDQLPNQAEMAINLRVIAETIQALNITEVWYAYGNLITKRPYLSSCLKSLNDLLDQHQVKRVTFCPLTKEGHPRHPLYLSCEVLKDQNKFNL